MLRSTRCNYYGWRLCKKENLMEPVLVFTLKVDIFI